jgi:simple sugar transport system permease protein
MVAIIIMIILNRTTLGFQLKAVGHSVNGSKYAGINYRRNVIISMTIAGALSGLGAALAYLPIKPDYFSTATKIVDYGFDGISVSLMAQNNPIGIIFAGIFTSYIRAGAKSMQFAGYDLQIANVVISVIIYMIAISNFISIMVKKYKIRIQENEKGDENV